MLKVRVAAADLPQGLLLRESDLEWTALPRSAVPDGAVTENGSSEPELDGSLLRHAVAKGKPVTGTDVMLPSASGFLAAILQPGMRAISVAVDSVSGNAGLIQPGDYVDLLLTRHDRDALREQAAVSAETVLSKVRVLAVGTDTKQPRAGGNVGANERARTVTMEVTPRMAEQVAVASQLGTLSLSLRSFATDIRDPGAIAADNNGPAPVFAADVSHVMARPEKTAVRVPVPAPEAHVAVYRGSESPDDARFAAAAPPLPSVAMPR